IPSAPGLHRSAATISATPCQQPGNVTAALPEELVMGHGEFQWGIVACAHLSAVMYIFHYLSIRLLAPTVDYFCKQPDQFTDMTPEEWMSVSSGSNDTKSRCTMYELPVPHQQASNGTRSVVPCTAWDYQLPAGVQTIVSTWDLVCDKAYYVPLATMYYTLGSFMFVPLLAQASDKAGRRDVIYACIVVAMCATFAVFIAPTFILFVLSRLFVAASMSTLRINTFILVFEVTSPQYRDYYCSIVQFGMVAGGAAVSVLQNIILDRQVVWVLGTMPTSLLVLGFYVVEDSPRWLLATWNIRRARRVILLSDQTRNLDTFSAILRREYDRRKSDMLAEPFNHTLTDVVVNPALRGRTAALCSIWFCVMFSLYGMYAVNPKAASVATSLFGISCQVCSVILSYVLLKTFERKRSLEVLFAVTCGLACFLSAMVDNVPDHMSKFVYDLTLSSTLLAAFVVYTYSLELYPTVVRATGVSAAYFCGRLGSVASPFLEPLSNQTHPSVPPLLIAAFMISARFLLHWLPETKHADIPDTVKELEK
ncbi:unnamed protein product, partial [Ixodes hexagonus]